MPSRPVMPPEHGRQCTLFLRELRRTANAKLSAERVGVPLQRFHHRRRHYPTFATRWAAAVAFAEAALAKSGRTSPAGTGAKTVGGEYKVSKGVNRQFQVKRAPKGHLTEAGERMFLEALAATANVNLACDVVGVSDGAIYLRRQKSDVFADKMDAALEHGYQRLELEMLEAATASLDATQLRGDWITGTLDAPSPLLRMSFDQVCLVLGMHRKRVTLGEDRRAHNRRVYRAEETDAAITDLLERLNRRKQQALARDERMAAREAPQGEAKKAEAEPPTIAGPPTRHRVGPAIISLARD